MPLVQNLKLTGDIQSNWNDFITNFKDIMESPEFRKKPDHEKLNIFLDSLGNEGHEIFETFNIPAVEVARGCILNKLIDRFEEYFNSFKNIPLYNSCRFFTRTQKKNEPFDCYLKEIQEIAKWCQFGALTKKLIRDRLISGIVDLNLQYKFKMMGEPSLEEIIETSKELEATKEKLNSIIGNRNFFFSDDSGRNNNNEVLNGSALNQSTNSSFNQSTNNTINLSTNSSPMEKKICDFKHSSPVKKEVLDSRKQKEGSVKQPAAAPNTDSQVDSDCEAKTKRRKIEMSNNADSGLELENENESTDGGKTRKDSPKDRFHCHRCPKSFAQQYTLKTHLMKCRSKRDRKVSKNFQGEKEKKKHEEEIKRIVSESDTSDETDDDRSSNHSTKQLQDANLQNGQLVAKNSQNGNRQNSKEKKSSDDTNKKFTCSDCGNSYSNAKILKHHVLEKCDKKKNSVSSNKVETTKVNQTEIQTDPNKHVCNYCNAGFSHERNLRLHFMICDAKNKSNGSGTSKSKEHFADFDKFKCSDCGKSFAHEKSLQRHRPACDGNDKKNSATGKNSSDDSSQNNADSATPGKVYTCNDCGITYGFSSSLVRHIQKCEIRIAKQNADMTSGKGAVVVLKSQELYTCDVCGMAYAHSSSLHRHKQKTCSKKNTTDPLISELLKNAEQAMSDME